MAYPTQGLMNGMVDPDQTPDTQKSAGDLFQELGIFSPSEKLQMQQRQQLAQQLYAQQQDQVKRQQALQAAQLGTGFGFPVFTAMGGLNQQSRGPQMPQQPQGDSFDPGSLVAQELQATPDDRAGALKRAGLKLMQVGSQKGDPTLQRIASNLIIKAQQESVKQQKAQIEQTAAADVHAKAGREEASAGNPDTPFEMNMPNGNKGKFAATKDANGKFAGYKFLGGGPDNVNQRVTQVPDDRKEYEEFRAYTESSDSLTRKLDQVSTNIKEGAAVGRGAKVVNVLNNAAGTLRQLVPGSDFEDSGRKALNSAMPTFTQWAQKTGVNSSVYMGLVTLQAKLDSTTGTITENDINRAMSEMGASFSDPETVLKILQNRKDQVAADVDTKYRYLSSGTQALAKTQYDTFKRNTTTKFTEQNPAKPTTTAEYDKLPSGTWYYNPHLKKTVQKK